MESCAAVTALTAGRVVVTPFFVKECINTNLPPRELRSYSAVVSQGTGHCCEQTYNAWNLHETIDGVTGQSRVVLFVIFSVRGCSHKEILTDANLCGLLPRECEQP